MTLDRIGILRLRELIRARSAQDDNVKLRTENRKLKLRTVLQRVLYTLPVIWLVVSLVFLLIHLVPGDPIAQMLGEGAPPPTSPPPATPTASTRLSASNTSATGKACCTATSDAPFATTKP